MSVVVHICNPSSWRPWMAEASLHYISETLSHKRTPERKKFLNFYSQFINEPNTDKLNERCEKSPHRKLQNVSESKES
jgi:NADH:ubiquinone oxidoreductase subunit E